MKSCFVLKNKRNLGIIVFAVFLALAAYLPVLVSWFTAEELVLLYKVKGHPFGIWSGGEGPGFLRPVVSLIFWLAESLWGLNPKYYHAMSVVFHLGNSLLVFLAAREWMRVMRGQEAYTSQVAAIAALFFWVWPSHSEPVGWIPGMTDVSAATFAITCIWAYCKFRNTDLWGWLVLSVLSYGVGLITKESVITIPAVIVIYEIYRVLITRKWTGRWPMWLGCYGVVLLAYLGVRYLTTGAFIGGYSTSFHTDFSIGRLRWALAPNLANAFMPIPGLTLWQKEVGLCVLVVGICIGLAMRKRHGGNDGVITMTFLFALAATVAFLPALNLGPGLIMEGQRFAYLASAFAVMALSSALVYVSPKRSLPIAFVIVIGCSIALCRYNIPRYKSGKIAREIVRGMKKLPPARRVYVLTSTASYDEAFVLPHGLHLVGQLMVRGYRPKELDTASTVVNWTPETKVIVTQIANDEYRLHLDFPKENGLLIPRLVAASGIYQEGWFQSRIEGPDVIVHLNGFDIKQDKVAYVQGGKWVLF